ncbi:MAG: DUF1501 domain-containing protein, partial [Planctomycetales bacterium]|nr:DUF1501 domain-containing protein [Planctomycetales bacterium]
MNLQLTRRWFLQNSVFGLGTAALAHLGAVNRLQAESNGLPTENPLASRAPHFAGRAKAVIHLFMAGAPSQLELFDNKPLLSSLEGQPLPKSIIGDQRYAFIQPD